MRLIDPKMSIDTIKSYIEVWDCKGCLPYGGTQHNVMAVDDLQYLPTIEAEPVRHGRWIDAHFVSGGDFNRCSECGCYIEKTYFANDYNVRYCPACGAKMDATDTNVGKKCGVHLQYENLDDDMPKFFNDAD